VIRHFFALLVLSVLLSGCSDANVDTYPVTQVVDGDTIKVLINGEEETIRLLLIDTPETVHPNKPIQPFGPEASAFVKQLLSEKRVLLELGISERDKYGRLLAYVYTAEGEMVNKLLLKNGLARVAYIYPPNTKYIDEFKEIQNQARKDNIGIWSIETYDNEDESKLTNDCVIKGNINSNGEKIYHVPSGQYYERTKAEKIFCTEKEAIQAGFRKSKR
jgi:micrococcal nuclease